MKKIYSLLIMAAAMFSANAQVVLTYNGETVDPSKTLEVKAEEISEYYEDWDFWDNRVECGNKDPKLTNKGNSAASVNVTVTVENLDVKMQWCFPEQCTFLASTTESRAGSIPANTSKALLLEPFFNYGEYATVKGSITIKEGSKSTTYKVNFIYEKSEGIQNIATSTANNAIFDLSGRRVAQPQSGNLYIQNGRKFIQK